MNKTTSNIVETAFGEALYPHLSIPDTQFNSEGIYQVKLKMSRADADKEMKTINNIISKEIAEEHKKHPGNTKLTKKAPLPYEILEDGYVVLKFKTKFKPKLFDHTGKNFIPDNKIIWGGSELKVRYTPVGYNVASTGIGCTLRLVSCQVRKLVEGSVASQGYAPVEPVLTEGKQ
tara:strand:+ start:311 stop:835 length:525 start_codon:yes stop_codon:yes gene_type:complete